MRDPRKDVESLKDRIKGSSDISSRDKDLLLEFSRQIDLLKSEYSDYRHRKLLRHCKIIAENAGNLNKALEDRSETESIVDWINSNYRNEETNQDYRSALRVFGKRVSRSNGIPSSIEWVPTGTSNSYNPSPDRAEMLEWSDVLDMIEEGALNQRDRALFAVAYDLGLRGFELYNLRVGDIIDGEHGVQVSVDGKQGERVVTCIPSVPYLNQWLSVHPGGDDMDPLWSKLNNSEKPSYNTFLEYFKDAASRIGLEKPVTPTNFRKSNAYWLAKQGASAALIEDRQGRSRGSKHVSRYIARFGPENESRQYASLHGKEITEEEGSGDLAPIECPRCDKETPRNRDLCVWCGQALDPSSAEEFSMVEDRAFEYATKAEGDFDVEAIKELRELLDRFPTVKSAVLED